MIEQGGNLNLRLFGIVFCFINCTLFILLQCSMNTFVQIDWSTSLFPIIPYQIWQSNLTFLIKFYIKKIIGKIIDIIIGYRI